MYVVFLAAGRCLFGVPYRQLEGFTRALHRLIPRLPPIDYSWLRRRILRLDLRPYMSLRGYDGPVSIAVDSSGVRVYGGRKRYIKIHFVVDINTKEAISMDVTMDDVYDSEVLPRLLKDASMMPCGLIPGLFRLSSLPFGDSCDVFGSRLRFLIFFRLKAYCHASIPLP